MNLLTIPEALRRRASDPDEAPDCEWLADHGQFWPTGADPEGGVERMIRVRRREGMRFPHGRCFNNVRRLVAADPWFRYVEGVALKTHSSAEWHAWAVTPAGFVVDPTWHADGAPPERQEYFGVAFEPDALEACPEAFAVHDGMIGQMFGDGRTGSVVNLLEIPADVKARVAEHYRRRQREAAGE